MTRLNLVIGAGPELDRAMRMGDCESPKISVQDRLAAAAHIARVAGQPMLDTGPVYTDRALGAAGGRTSI